MNQHQDLIIVKQLWPYSLLEVFETTLKFLQFRRALSPNSARQRERKNSKFSLFTPISTSLILSNHPISNTTLFPPQQKKCGLPEGVHICDVLITGKITSKSKSEKKLKIKGTRNPRRNLRSPKISSEREIKTQQQVS